MTTKPDQFSSDDDEYEEEEDDECQQEEDGVPVPPSNKAPQQKPSANPTAAKLEEEEDDSCDEEDDESCDESGGGDEDGAVDKPIAHQPKPHPEQPPPEACCNNEPAPASASASSRSLKRKAPGMDTTHGGDKRRVFLRVWSLKDEINLLKAVRMYQKKTGIVPISKDIETFRDFVQDSIPKEISNKQILDKLRKLKYKFEANVARGNNAACHFLNSHEKDVYDLSKKIWGKMKGSLKNYNDGADSKEKERKTASGAEGHASTVNRETCVFASVKSRFPYLSEELAKFSDDGLVKKRVLDNLDVAKAERIEEKLKKTSKTLMRLKMREMKLVEELLKLFCDVP